MESDLGETKQFGGPSLCVCVWTRSEPQNESISKASRYAGTGATHEQEEKRKERERHQVQLNPCIFFVPVRLSVSLSLFAHAFGPRKCLILIEHPNFFCQSKCVGKSTRFSPSRGCQTMNLTGNYNAFSKKNGGAEKDSFFPSKLLSWTPCAGTNRACGRDARPYQEILIRKVAPASQCGLMNA